jgi:MoxR-like ATPase
MPVFSQELIQEKIRYCEELENRIYALLRSDTEKAREELLYLALQAARIILLKNRIIPGVKYEIPLQVKEFNEDISRIVQELVDGKKIGKERILEYMKRCMAVVT